VPQPVVDGVAHGMIAFYGKYTVNLIGGEQKRIR
jgi:hypothetical protein